MATKTTIFVNYTQLEPINRGISLKEMIVFYRHILAPTIGHLIGNWQMFILLRYAWSVSH